MEAKMESPLERHIGFFSTKGNVSYESIEEKLTQMGDHNAKFKANAISFMAGLKIKSCPYSMFKPAEGVGALNHARDTGIYQKDGSINEARWQKLCTWSENDNGVMILTQKNFDAFLQWARDNDDRWDLAGLGKKFSDGEWIDFFTFCTDYWKKTDAGMERSVTLETLRTFFENTPEILNKVINHELPVMQPEVILNSDPVINSFT